MSGLRRLERIAPLLALLVAATILLVGLDRHGIWDPTELSFAESVREQTHLEGRPPLYGALVRLGFQAFDSGAFHLPRDLSGRFFGAVASLFAAVAAMGLARRHFDGRTAAYAAVAAASTPLVVLNARWMVGDGASIGLSSLVGLGLFVAAFDRTRDGSRIDTATWARVLGLVLALAAAIVGTLFRGALLVVLPPLLAIAGVTVVEPRVLGRSGRFRIGITAIGLALTATIAALVVRDAGSYSILLGGVPGGEAPPGFERYLQVAFHTLAPYSPLFVLGAARSVVTSDDASEAEIEAQRVRLALVLWATFAFGAATLFASRYGTPTFLGVVPVTLLAVVTLRESETTRPIDLGAALVVAMLLALIIRDYALYPASPLAGVPVGAPVLAPDFQPRAIWAALFLLFGATFGLGAASSLVDGRTLRELVARLAVWRGPRETLVTRILTFASLGILELVLIVVAILGERVGMASVAVRGARFASVALPLGLVVVSVGTVLALFAFSKLRTYRMVPTVVTGALIGAFVQGPFLVDLSGDLSPRDVFATYNELRGRNEGLAVFDLRSRATDYYIDGRVTTLPTRERLVALLAQTGERRWAIFKRNVLADVDRDHRALTGRHVIIADARNEGVVLATNLPIPGRRDQNPLSRAIRRGDVHPQHPTNIRFDDVELVGYDLDLPNGSSVGAGQSFRITWYWKVLRRPTVNWRVFVHIDGSGLRLNGDHDPVEGLLLMSQWTVGDTIADVQELDVPASYPADDFTMYVGFFNGDQRMNVVSGQHTNDNRAIAGILRVR